MAEALMANQREHARPTSRATGSETATATLTDTVSDVVERGRASVNAAADYVGESLGDMPGVEQAQRAATAVAGQASAAADYLREADMDEVVVELQDLVRRHPVPAMLVAGAVGFLIGRMINR